MVIFLKMLGHHLNENPKDSNVYRTNARDNNSTPKGSNIFVQSNCYIHIIPSELI